MAFSATVRLSFGDDVFDMKGVKASEMSDVKTWTGLGNRSAWLAAITAEDIDALRAALVIAKRRKGEDVKFRDVDFDFDTMNVALVDDSGAEVEPVFLLDPFGDPLLVKYEGRRPAKDDKGGYIVDNEDGAPVPELDEHGQQKWRYVGSGDLVPTTAA